MADDDLDYQRPEQFSRVPDVPSGLFTPSSLMPQQFTLPTDKPDTSGGIPTVLGDKIDQTAFLKAQGRRCPDQGRQRRHGCDDEAERGTAEHRQTAD